MKLSFESVDGSVLEGFVAVAAALEAAALGLADGALSGAALGVATAAVEAGLEDEGVELWRRAALSVANFTSSLPTLADRSVGAEGVAPVVVAEGVAPVVVVVVVVVTV